MTDQSSHRTIGLGGAVFTLVGYVIGASIFVLPGQLAAEAGPAAFVSYLIAGALAAVSCLVGASIGSTVHVSGAANVAVARTLAPVLGFLGVWITLVAVVVSIALVAYGLADYVAYFWPSIDRRWVALAAVAVFAVLNLSTVQLAVSAQIGMTIGFLVIMFGFGIGGVAHAKPELVTPFMPNGFGPVASGAVLAFFSYAGITVITELGGEIKNPARTIPLTLLIGFLVVLTSYALVSFAVPALLPWQTLKGMSAPIARAAEVFLPAWIGGVIAVAALLAAATSINGMLLIHSRDVLAMARARVFPEALAARNQAGVPAQAVGLVSVLSVVAVVLGGTVRQYAMMAVMSVMILQVFQGLALLRLPRVMPVEWAQAGFKLEGMTRTIVVAVLVVVSAGFFGLGFLDNLAISAGYLVVVVAGLAYYWIRRAALDKAGYDMDAVLRSGGTAEG